MADTRQAIVAWAHWLMEHKAEMNYSEGPARMSAIGVWPPKFPIDCDCSAFVTLCYWLAGADDPNGQHYDHEGYTGTLLSHGLIIPREQVQAGDVIVYGPGTGWHTALVVEPGHDPLTISMGQQGDPSLVYVSQDGRQPQTYLRFHTGANTVRTPHELDKPVVKVAESAIVTAPKVQPVATAEPKPQPPVEPAHIEAKPEATQSAPVAPHEAESAEAVHSGPIAKMEHLIEEIIEGPKS